jgi:hypothetical protein
MASCQSNGAALHGGWRIGWSHYLGTGRYLFTVPRPEGLRPCTTLPLPRGGERTFSPALWAVHELVLVVERFGEAIQQLQGLEGRTTDAESRTSTCPSCRLCSTWQSALQAKNGSRTQAPCPNCCWARSTSARVSRILEELVRHAVDRCCNDRPCLNVEPNARTLDEHRGLPGESDRPSRRPPARKPTNLVSEAPASNRLRTNRSRRTV